MKGMFLWVSAIHSLRCEPLIRTCSPLLISSLSQSTCYDVGKVGGVGGKKETNPADWHSVGEVKAINWPSGIHPEV